MSVQVVAMYSKDVQKMDIFEFEFAPARLSLYVIEGIQVSDLG